MVPGSRAIVTFAVVAARPFFGPRARSNGNGAEAYGFVFERCSLVSFKSDRLPQPFG